MTPSHPEEPTQNTPATQHQADCECDKCGHKWIATHPINNEDCFPIECPECGYKNWVSTGFEKPVHLIISNMNDATFIKPSRPVPVWRIRELLHNASQMINEGGSMQVMTPEDSSLRAWLTVDDSQGFDD